MPDKCWSVLSAERSAVSIARALPARRISTVPAATCVAIRDQRVDRRRRDRAGGKRPRRSRCPATTIGSRQFIAAVKRASAGMVAAEVTSPPSPRSSASVRGDEIVEIEAVGKRHRPRLAAGASVACKSALACARLLGRGRHALDALVAELDPAPVLAGEARRVAVAKLGVGASRLSVTSTFSPSTTIRLKLCCSSRSRVEVAVPAWITSAPVDLVTKSAESWWLARWLCPASSRSTPSVGDHVEHRAPGS